MSGNNPTPIKLADYRPPDWLVSTVALDFDFGDGGGGVVVAATLDVMRNPVAGTGALPPMLLDGEELETLSIRVDGRTLSAGDYELTEKQLRLHVPAEHFRLETRVRIRPDANTQLSGLYRSRDGYFTQCEAQGFRRITWFPDRPDVMARYTVTIHADRAMFPVLLANGNPVGSGEEEGGRHFAVWKDPFPKPSYLFALVAGRLDVLRDRYRTRSGRDVQLAVFVEPGKLDQCGHAMEALKKSMAWDEKTYGLECDLDHYMIVAVGDFNMGAMENKGLNIFNTKYVLARGDVATDADFNNIDRVVAHEYFHNWTGNRVTCREWFQLSLKEGLTVFRDQQFGEDEHDRETARIQEVRQLRAAQFPEDAGPMAHPVRPDTYLEISNFYTATVYEKGAEVIRMIRTLIGAEAFRRGMDLYFQRHDGQAVTCEDFVAAMADASGFDFARFMPWYSRAGTPRVTASGQYDAARQRYTLTLAQFAPSAAHATTRATTGATASAGQTPWLIPFAVGLVGPDGKDIDLGGVTTRVLQFAEARQTFVFDNIPVQPVPSLLRGFSAPVVLTQAIDEAGQAHLFAHDSDAFNRWEAGQRMFGRVILDAATAIQGGVAPDDVAWPGHVLDSARRVLTDGRSTPGFICEALTLPSEATLAEAMAVVDPEALFAARLGLARFMARGMREALTRLYESLAPTGAYAPTQAQMGRRRLRNLCLNYLAELDAVKDGERPGVEAARQQFRSADNMTDQFAALAVLVNAPGGEGREEQHEEGGAGGSESPGRAALADFFARWQGEALVVDKWLAVQASCRRSDTQARVAELLDHPAFDIRNPNKVYALLRTFGANHRHFHAADGTGYRFLAEQIAVLDPINPQVASRLARCFDRWRRFDAARQAHARAALELVAARPGLSGDVAEVVGKALL